MKKIWLYTCILLIAFSGCKKDKDEEVDQLSMTLKNLTTLLGKTSNYIKAASPGDLDTDETDYMYFKIFDVIPGIDRAYIYYNLDDDECDFIIMFSDYEDTIEHSEIMMSMTEDELGDNNAEWYYIGYYDTSDVFQEQEFMTFDGLWKYVADSSITALDLEEISALYHYNDSYLYSGGYLYENALFSMVEIGWWDFKKKSVSSELFQGPFRHNVITPLKLQ